MVSPWFVIYLVLDLPKPRVSRTTYVMTPGHPRDTRMIAQEPQDTRTNIPEPSHIDWSTQTDPGAARSESEKNFLIRKNKCILEDLIKTSLAAGLTCSLRDFPCRTIRTLAQQLLYLMTYLTLPSLCHFQNDRA